MGLDQLAQFPVGQAGRAGAECVNQHRHRVRNADGVRQLHLHAVGKAGRDAVLCDIARHIGGGTVHLRRILAGEGAAAVRRHAAVGVDDDLPAGQATVASRPTGDEPPGRVDMDNRLVIHQFRRERRPNHAALDVRPDSLDRHRLGMLARNHDLVDALRFVVLVLHRHLRLAVGPEVVDQATPPRRRERTDQAVRQHDRHRHQFLRAGAGVAEHQPLITCAPRVHPHGNVTRLRVQLYLHVAAVGVEAERLIGVADIAHRLSRHLRVVHPCVGGDLSRQDDQVGGQERLAGDPAVRILCEDRVEHSVRHLIGDFVRVALRDRLRRKEVTACSAHGLWFSLTAAGAPGCGATTVTP